MQSVPSRLRSLAALTVLSAVLGTAALGCTDDSTEGEVERDRSPSTTQVAPSDPEIFEGSVEDFYVLPQPLPPGEPGELIRVQQLGEVDGSVTSRVMYHSNDALGRDRAVTGIVTYPSGDAPPEGWPVISTAHGTTGVASQCAPSRSGGPAPDWGVQGVRVMTDYVGLGPVDELHPYLSKPSEGNAVIDAVRAARQIPAANASDRWLSIGHSQGGHGALSAHELASDRAPELDLVGTVALAPGVMLDRVYGGIDPIVTTILTMMAMYGGASEHPDIDLADYLTPEAIAAAKVVETDCLDGITSALIPVAIEGPFVADPRHTEPARSALLGNDVGHVAVEGVPLLLISGTADDRVVIERVRDLFDRLCDAEQVTEFHVLADADHSSVVTESADQVTTWIEDRLAGTDPIDSCPTQPVPTRP